MTPVPEVYEPIDFLSLNENNLERNTENGGTREKWEARERFFYPVVVTKINNLVRPEFDNTLFLDIFSSFS